MPEYSDTLLALLLARHLVPSSELKAPFGQNAGVHVQVHCTVTAKILGLTGYRANTIFYVMVESTDFMSFSN